MSETIKIKKGADIKLKGAAEKVVSEAPMSDTYVVKPSDFHGVTPKLVVKVGAKVKAGTVLFFDKYSDKVKFASPVSGEIVEIIRGEKRRVLEIVIKADKEIQYEQKSIGELSSLNREQVKSAMLEGGLWPFVIQRPYAVIANPADTPKAIFISAFNSEPLAADNDFILHGEGENFQAGLDAIAKLTDGKVHLTVSADNPSTKVFTNSKGVQLHKISGPHPAGNVGIQIHHIDPINKGDVVWTLTPQDILTIGRYFKTGMFDASRVVAVAGSQVLKPKYYKTLIGTSIKPLVEGNVAEGNNRFISGGIFNGDKISQNGHLGYYHNQVLVLPEGDQPQFMGWLSPGFDKFSLSKTFFSWLTPNKEYVLTTAMNGEERAFVTTGEYEKVFPMDIYPQHLVKACITKDIDAMEGLGIYEVAPEDFALCEYGCTSKIETQKIVREALDIVKKELS